MRVMAIIMMATETDITYPSANTTAKITMEISTIESHIGGTTGTTGTIVVTLRSSRTGAITIG